MNADGDLLIRQCHGKFRFPADPATRSMTATARVSVEDVPSALRGEAKTTKLLATSRHALFFFRLRLVLRHNGRLHLGRDGLVVAELHRERSLSTGDGF